MQRPSECVVLYLMEQVMQRPNECVVLYLIEQVMQGDGALQQVGEEGALRHCCLVPHGLEDVMTAGEGSWCDGGDTKARRKNGCESAHQKKRITGAFNESRNREWLHKP